jgi:hypothetical protein
MEKQEIRDKYAERVALGRRAKEAYDLYLEDFINQRHSELVYEFLNGNKETVDYAFLRERVDAVNYLKTAILSDINSGRMAEADIQEMNNDH